MSSESNKLGELEQKIKDFQVDEIVLSSIKESVKDFNQYAAILRTIYNNLKIAEKNDYFQKNDSQKIIEA